MLGIAIDGFFFFAGRVSNSVALLAALLAAALPLLLPNDLLFLNCRRVVEFLRSSGTLVVSSLG